ncbi:hypothetical protein G7054_g626 [Neopestalotiopsis clavispora]|nr:hypothetical protein G7054_g626 [Neopestalotiopsis clavispora]
MVSLFQFVLSLSVGAVARATLQDCFTLQGFWPNDTDLHHVVVTGNGDNPQLFQANFTTNYTAATRFGIATGSGHLISYASHGRIANVGLGYDDDYMLFYAYPFHFQGRDPLLCGLSKDNGVLSCAAESNAIAHVIVFCGQPYGKVLIVAPKLPPKLDAEELAGAACYEAKLVASQAEGCMVPSSNTSRIISSTGTKSTATKHLNHDTTSAGFHLQPNPTSATTSRHWNTLHSHVTIHQPHRPSVS